MLQFVGQIVGIDVGVYGRFVPGGRFAAQGEALFEVVEESRFVNNEQQERKGDGNQDHSGHHGVAIKILYDIIHPIPFGILIGVGRFFRLFGRFHLQPPRQVDGIVVRRCGDGIIELKRRHEGSVCRGRESKGVEPAVESAMVTAVDHVAEQIGEDRHHECALDEQEAVGTHRAECLDDA